MIRRVLLVCVIFNVVNCHENSQHSDEVVPMFLWDYYGKAHIDLKHIFEETKNIIKLRDENKISLLEAAFYYHRLHDFNNDGYLDGLELLHTMNHVSTNQTDSTNLESLASAVDDILSEIDYNNDGLIDYPEISTYLNQKTNPKND